MKSSHAPIQASWGLLATFTLMTFALAWGVLGMYIFFNTWATDTFGALSGQHPLFYLAVWAPAISALILIVWLRGWGAVWLYLTKLARWRVSKAWLLMVILVIPAVFYLGYALKTGGMDLDWPFGSFGLLLLILVLAAIKGPIEELGWRGFALPLLQQWMSPLAAAVLIGLVWGFWHLPAFLISGTEQSAWSFMPFFLGAMCISILITLLYNATAGSLLWPAVLHFQLMIRFGRMLNLMIVMCCCW